MTATLRRGLLALALLCVLAWGAFMVQGVEKAEASFAAADTTPPTASIDSGPGDTSDGAATFTFSADEPATFECKLVTAANATVVNWASCVSPKTYSGLSDDDYIFRLRATDTAGNLSVVKGQSFTVVNGGGGVAQCADGVDNDGDGKIDLADPGCSSSTDDDEFNSPPTGGSAVLVGAGDIGEPPLSATKATGDVVRRELANGALYAFTLGDDAYPDGTLANYNSNYDPGWGSFVNKTLPTLGNHEYYGSSTAAGSASYWGSRSAAPVSISNNNSYYVKPVPNTNWRVLVLNSMSGKSPKTNQAPACTSGSAQYNFALNEMKADLPSGSHPANLMVAYHHPRFSNGSSHDSAEGAMGCSKIFWDMAFDNKADLVMNGHTHGWERFSGRDKSGAKIAGGLTEIVAGTGGAGTDTIAGSNPVADKQIDGTIGVAKVELNPSGAQVTYLPAAGQSGSDSVTVPVRP